MYLPSISRSAFAPSAASPKLAKPNPARQTRTVVLEAVLELQCLMTDLGFRDHA